MNWVPELEPVSEQDEIRFERHMFWRNYFLKQEHRPLKPDYIMRNGCIINPSDKPKLLSRIRHYEEDLNSECLDEDLIVDEYEYEEPLDDNSDIFIQTDTEDYEDLEMEESSDELANSEDDEF